MKKNYLKNLTIVSAAAAMVLSSCSRYEMTPQVSGNTETAITEGKFVDRLLRIKVSEEYAEKMESIIAQNGYIDGETAENIFGIAGVESITQTANLNKFPERKRKMGLHLWFDVKLSENSTLTKAQTGLKASDGISVIEMLPAITYDKSPITSVSKGAATRADGFFNDPDLAKQWFLSNDGKTVEGSVAGCDVNILPVWESLTAPKNEVIVAVLDEGVEVTHEDLVDNLWENPDPSASDRHGYDFVKNSSEIEAGDHGTHVAGLIAAVNNNGKGISSIAGGDKQAGIPGTKIMSCRIAGANVPANAIFKAMEYAADNGAVISQNSWSYGDGDYDFPESDREAIDYFIQYAGTDGEGNQTGPMKGGLVVFAAGNYNTTIGYPAMYSKVVAVGSIGYDFTKASSSNYGEWIDICAPGGEKLADTKVLSTVTGNGYGEKSGTSMAAPMVSAVASLIIAKEGGEGFTADMLKSRLLSSGRNIDSYHKGTVYAGQLGRLVDAEAAVLGAGSTQAPEAVSDLKTSVHSNNLMIEWTATADPDDEKAYGYMLCYSSEPFDNTVNKADLPTTINTIDIKGEDYKAGEIIRDTIRGLEFEKKYYTAVFCYDKSGNYSDFSQITETTTGNNNAPVLDPGEDIDIIVENTAEPTVMTIKYSDPDWHSVTWDVMRASNALTPSSTKDGELVLTFDGSKATPKRYHGSLTVTDPYGLETKIEIYYTIKGMNAPVVETEISDITLDSETPSATIDLGEHFSDPDREILTYTAVSSDEKVATVSVADDILTVTSVADGNAEITVTATDGAENSVSCTFNVKVGNGDSQGGGDIENPEVTGFTAYPNPVRDILNIKTADSAEMNVTVYNTLGNTVFSGKLTAGPETAATINMKSLPAGVYRLVADFGNSKHTEQIVKL